MAREVDIKELIASQPPKRCLLNADVSKSVEFGEPSWFESPEDLKAHCSTNWTIHPNKEAPKGVSEGSD